jgi:hypothetical protein
VTPYLAVTSAEKQSGKTRLLEVLEALVADPLPVVSPSAASLYRSIEAAKPTEAQLVACALFVMHYTAWLSGKCGRYWVRTSDLLRVRQALSRLS